MGNKLEKQDPEKHLSDEMIDKGKGIGRVAIVLGMLQKEVAAKKAGAGNHVGQYFSSPTAGTGTAGRSSNASSPWAKLVNKGKKEEKELSPVQMKKAREEERNTWRNEDPHFRYTEEIIDYDTLVEEDMDKRQCNYCNLLKRDDVFECRICGKSFHRECLLRRGIGQDLNSEMALKDAEQAGWTCLDCENLAYVIPMDIMTDIMTTFDSYDRSGTATVTFADYLRHARTLERREGTPCNETELRKKFLDYDRDNDGKVTWNDYVMVEAIAYLKKLPTHEVIRFMKPIEVDRMRILFRDLDTANTGVLTIADSEKAYRKWLASLDIAVRSEMTKSEERSSGPNQKRLITWERFIRNKALSVITARPNTRTIRPYLTSMDHHWMDSTA